MLEKAVYNSITVLTVRVYCNLIGFSKVNNVIHAVRMRIECFGTIRLKSSFPKLDIFAGLDKITSAHTVVLADLAASLSA